MDNVLRGGGSLVWRRREDESLEIALVRRLKQSDWSLPKGKCENQDSQISTAYRVTIKDTGFDVKFSRYLGDAEYKSNDGIGLFSFWRAKYQTTLERHDFSEIEEVRWFDLKRAVSEVAHDSERVLIQKFADSDLDTKVLILLRHCKALARNEWVGDDTNRPLDNIGIAQANRLVENLIPFGISEIHSSDAARCYESINPLAKHLSLNYFFTNSLSEIVYDVKPNRVFKYIEKLLENESTTLVCSHNPILPNYLEGKLEKQGFKVSDTFLKPGDAWVIHHIQKEILGVDKIEVPIIA